MRNERNVQWISIIGFIGSVYFGLPKLLPKKISEEKLIASADSWQADTIRKGKISGHFLGVMPRGKVITQPDISKFGGDTLVPAIFPPDLIFQSPPKQSQGENDQIAQAQRIALLENKIAALETELFVLKPSQSWTWTWGFEKLWALAIWFFGTIVTTALKHHTEQLLKKENK